MEDEIKIFMKHEYFLPTPHAASWRPPPYPTLVTTDTDNSNPKEACITCMERLSGRFE